MKTGYYISGIGHALVILWILLGGVFSASRHPPVEVANVSLVTTEEFEAMTAPASAPRADAVAPAPIAPDQPAEAPVVPQPEAPQVSPRPTARPEPVQPDPVPEAAEPQPPTEVVDERPTPPAPPSETEGTTVLTETAPPRPAPRVAPVPALAPDPAAVPDEVVAEVTAPSPDAATPAPTVDVATAPPEASTQIVTEAETTDNRDAVLTASVRPRARPARPDPAPTPEVKPTPPRDPIADAVAQAVAGGAQETTGNGTAPVGPPLTSGEKDALRIAVQSCWSVDPGSPAARITVVVGISLSEDGMVDGNSLKLLSDSGGDPAAIRSAFDAARRAILRCQKNGYALPKEKYAQWRNIEITFDPSKMRK